MIFKKTESEFLQVAATRECDFTMGTILGKGFAQAQVHTGNITIGEQKTTAGNHLGTHNNHE